VHVGVPSGKLLGYIVSAQFIDANPINMKAILKMGPIEELKDAQKIMGLPSGPKPFHIETRREGIPPTQAPTKEFSN
jgi:hypothetical protein